MIIRQRPEVGERLAQAKALGRHIKFKDRSKWYGHDGVKSPVKTAEVSGFRVNCCTPMAYESTRLQVDNALMAVSILHDDADGFASALKGYIDVLNTIRTDGSLPYQTARGNAALWYQNLGINVLVMAAEMAANRVLIYTATKRRPAPIYIKRSPFWPARLKNLS